MENIRIRNLRSFEDTGVIDFKKINVFVGQNSSGKSTLLRCFPLLKQSSQVKTFSDILWFGPSVDFGSFEEALSRNAKEQKVNFEISLDVTFRRLRNRARRGFESSRKQFPTSLSITITPSGAVGRKTYLSEYEIRIFEQSIRLVLDENLLVKHFSTGQNFGFTEHAQEEFVFFRTYGLLPAAMVAPESEGMESRFLNLLCSFLRPFVHGLKSTDDIINAIVDLEIAPPENVLEQLKRLNLGDFWKIKIKDWTTETPELRTVCELLAAYDFDRIFEAVGDSVTRVAQSVQYVAPLRATAERYYREQGLSVDEIDPSGRNLAMFLRNLSEADAREFALWTADNMGFEIRAETTQGHVSLVLSDPGSTERVNLADTGFGFSQVLPILAQIWHSRKRDYANSRIPKYLAIEQPELHLHPKMQARLAEIFVKMVKLAGTGDLRIVVETHSEILISQLGKAVERGAINSSDIAIYIFEKSTLAGSTRVSKSAFDSQGYLTQWPYGFFDAGDSRSDAWPVNGENR